MHCWPLPDIWPWDFSISISKDETYPKILLIKEFTLLFAASLQQIQLASWENFYFGTGFLFSTARIHLFRPLELNALTEMTATSWILFNLKNKFPWENSVYFDSDEVYLSPGFSLIANDGLEGGRWEWQRKSGFIQFVGLKLQIFLWLQNLNTMKPIKLKYFEM